MTLSKEKTSKGTIVQIIGAVIDVEFPREAVPQIYSALKVDKAGLTLEVQQQLGDGVVRAIAMGVSEGLERGLEVTDTKKPISVPVGKATLGRIMNVLGEPVDDAGPVEAEEHWSIHRDPPSFEEQAGSQELLETGIKVIDLLVRSPRAARSGCSAARASARPSTCSNSSATSPPSIPVCRCSPASASAPARATTSITR